MKGLSDTNTAVHLDTALRMREADTSDLDYLIWADYQHESFESNASNQAPDPSEHADSIRPFVSDPDLGAWVLVNECATNLIHAGMILFRFRTLVEPRDGDYARLFHELPSKVFPPGGWFCEVFNLRVEPEYRRQGLATRLKNQMEVVARERDVRLLYTHTEERNAHVIELNRRLGYEPIRCGPIWDDVPRFSLTKRLQ